MNLGDILTTLDTLATGQLSHRIGNSGMLNSHLQAIEADLKKRESHFKFVFQHSYQYHVGPLVTVTNNANMLVV